MDPWASEPGNPVYWASSKPVRKWKIPSQKQNRGWHLRNDTLGGLLACTHIHTQSPHTNMYTPHVCTASYAKRRLQPHILCMAMAMALNNTSLFNSLVSGCSVYGICLS